MIINVYKRGLNVKWADLGYWHTCIVPFWKEKKQTYRLDGKY